MRINIWIGKAHVLHLMVREYTKTLFTSNECQSRSIINFTVAKMEYNQQHHIYSTLDKGSRTFFTTDFIARLKTSNYSTIQDLSSYSYWERVKLQKINSVTVSVLQRQQLLNSKANSPK